MNLMKRPRWLRFLGLCVFSVGALTLVACATTINQILADPSHYRNRDVKVTGTVADSYSLADRGAYRIADGTGELWVVSERGVPRKGARVEVTGTIREGFNLGGLGERVKLPGALGTGLVLMESSHKAK